MKGEVESCGLVIAIYLNAYLCQIFGGVSPFWYHTSLIKLPFHP